MTYKSFGFGVWGSGPRAFEGSSDLTGSSEWKVATLRRVSLDLGFRV